VLEGGVEAVATADPMPSRVVRISGWCPIGAPHRDGAADLCVIRGYECPMRFVVCGSVACSRTQSYEVWLSSQAWRSVARYLSLPPTLTRGGPFLVEPQL
jgi:hypothetical protein